MSTPIDLTTTAFVKTYINIGNSPSGQPIPITSVAIATNELTVVADNTFYVGQQVQFNNMTAAFLNGQVVTLDTASSTQFTAPFTYVGTYPTTPDVGVAQGLQTVTFDDVLLGQMVTDASQLIYDLCGRDILYDDEGNPTGGMFNEPTEYTEVQDGQGGIRAFLRNAPIQSVTSVTVGSQTVPASTGLTNPGYVIDQNRRSIAIRPGGGSGTFQNFGNFYGALSWTFCEGIQNVQFVYTAGYASVPSDLAEACAMLVAVNYARKSRLELASVALPEAGQTSYRGFAIPPQVLIVINKYKRKVIIS
jgi:hypothetical protein